MVADRLLLPQVLFLVEFLVFDVGKRKVIMLDYWLFLSKRLTL